MRYLLDTNVCVMYLNGRSISVRDRLRSTRIAEMVVCSVVKGELFYGAMRSNNPPRTLERQREFLDRLLRFLLVMRRRSCVVKFGHVPVPEL